MALLAGPLQAQDSDAIMYAENGTGVVATFTATDQEGQTVYWSLAPAGSAPDDGGDLEVADAADAANFSISADGVLTFNMPPDHESPDDAGADNEYNIVIVASDGAPGSGTNNDPIQMGYKKVVVEVTEVDEAGVITLSSLQPQVGAELTATLSDVEVTPNPPTNDNSLTWKWERSQSGTSGWETIPNAVGASLTPVDDDLDHYLRVTATYEVASDDDTERTAQAVSVNKARATPPTADATAVFPDGSDERDVDENMPAGTDVGDPVAATDTVDDVLTYSLSGTAAASFEIDPATGQITVGSRTLLDHETTPSYSVTVTATEASGDEVTQPITITVNDVNESPMVTGGVTMQSHAEDDADITTDDADVLTVATYTATDPETAANNLEWSVDGADKDLFDIGEADGALVFKDAPNYEMPADAGSDNVYNVTVVATDDGVDADGKNEMTAMRDVVITVTNVEEAGTVTLSAQQPKAGVELTASVTDLDDGVTGVKWQWYDGAIDANDLTENAIEDATSAAYTPKDGDVGDDLSARATYTDNFGEDAAMASAPNVVLARGDHTPEFAATETGKRSIAEAAAAGDAVGDPVTATDGDTADILTYRLSGPDAASFTIEQADNTANPATVGGEIRVKAGTKLDHETKPTHMVTVTATDPGGLSDSIDVTITVTNVNEAPEVMGDAEIEYEETWTRDLETYTAVDQEGQKVYWSLMTTLRSPVPEVDGEPLVNADFEDNGDFSISAGGVLTFNIPPDHESPDDDNTDNEYKIVIVASDGAPGSGTTDDPTQMGYKKVVVEVTEVDEAGVITLSSLQPQVGAELTATLADPEAPTPAALTWKWERSRSRSSGFVLATGTGADTNAYTPVDEDEHHYLRVTATYDVASDDDTERTPQAVSVNKAWATPTTTDETAVFPTGSNARDVDENLPASTDVGDPVAATDTVDDVLTYSLSGTNAPSFEIDPATGQITVGSRTLLDHETTPSYSVTVTATEASGDTDATVRVDITVNDVNEAPTVTDGVTLQTHAEDDADIDTDDTTVLTVDTYMATDPEERALTWSVDGADKDLFDIGETDGALVFKDAPNYEMPTDAGGDNVYNVTVVATDAGVDDDDENEMTAMRDVVITVTNVEEAGTVTLSAQQPKAGVELTASVTDLDDGVTDVKWQWYDGTINDGDLTENAIEDATSSTYTPKDGDVGETLSARATYTDNFGEDAAMATASNAVLARGDHEPEFAASETGKRTIPEDAAEGANVVGGPVTATDGDTDDILTYRLSGPDAASFTIEQADDTANPTADGGEIRVKAGTKLDHETKPTHMVTVTATDPGGLSASVDVTITVDDVNEAPEIMLGGLVISGPARVDYAEDRRDAVATYRASGPESANARWLLEGDDAEDFEISSNGELTFLRAPDSENPADGNRDNTYMVTVKADDDTYMDTHEVTVTVTDVDETVVGQTPLQRYDDNDNGRIDKEELVEAIFDYNVNETLEKAQLVDLIFTMSSATRSHVTR